MKKELKQALEALVEETKRGSNDAKKHDEIMKRLKEAAVETKMVFSDAGNDYKSEVYEVRLSEGEKEFPIWVGLYKNADELEGTTSEIALAKLFYIDFLGGVYDWFRNEVESVEELIEQGLKSAT